MVANEFLIDTDERAQRLVEAMGATPANVSLAFWGKPTDADKFYLYLASSYVDDLGSTAAYGEINKVLRRMPELQIEPLDVKVLGMSDSLTEAALAKTWRMKATGPFAGPNAPSPCPTKLLNCTLGGYEFDEVLIYPPRPTQDSP